MTSAEQPVSGSNTPVSAGMRDEIATKWSKFDASEIANLKGNDDLVSKVASKYGIDAKQAQKEVDALAKGRQL